MVKAVQPMGIVFASGKTYAVGLTNFLLEPARQALRFDAALGCAVFSLRHGRVGISGAYRARCGDEDGHGY